MIIILFYGIHLSSVVQCHLTRTIDSSHHSLEAPSEHDDVLEFTAQQTDAPHKTSDGTTMEAHSFCVSQHTCIMRGASFY